MAEMITKEKTEKHDSQFRGVVKRLSKNKMAVLGFIIFVILILTAILAPVIAPYPYTEMDPTAICSPPSLQHICGTDELGRDIFSRLLYGTRYSLGLGICSQIFTLFFSIILGSVAGYYGGWVDNLIMRMLDVFQAIPGLLLAIVVSTALGTGFVNTVIAMGVGGIPFMSRMLRAQILTVRDKEFLEAAASINCSKKRQIFKYVLPNSIAPLIVSCTMGIGATIMMAASLSYIGLGVQPPTPEWGAMLSSAKTYLRYYPYMLIFPGIMIAITVFALNMFGDGLRDAMDPKLKK